MEDLFNMDLTGVRLHTDADARDKAAWLEARAFTAGNHIWFGPGHGPADRRLLQHELAHVVQQAQGRAAGLRGAGGDPAQRASLEMEASQASSTNATSSSFARAQAPAEASSQWHSSIAIQLDGLAPSAQTITVRTPAGRQYTTSKNSPEFREKYIDFNMDHITFWLAPASDPDPKKKRFTVYYKNKKKAVFDLDEIQVRKHRVWPADTPKQATIKGMQVTPARTITFEGMPPSYTEEGGLIFPDRYTDASTPNLVAVATVIRAVQNLEADLLPIREATAAFGNIIAAGVTGIESVKSSLGAVTDTVVGAKDLVAQLKQSGKGGGKGPTSAPKSAGLVSEEGGTPQPKATKTKSGGSRKASAQALASREADQPFAKPVTEYVNKNPQASETEVAVGRLLNEKAVSGELRDVVSVEGAAELKGKSSGDYRLIKRDGSRISADLYEPKEKVRAPEDIARDIIDHKSGQAKVVVVNISDPKVGLPEAHRIVSTMSRTPNHSFNRMIFVKEGRVILDRFIR